MAVFKSDSGNWMGKILYHGCVCLRVCVSFAYEGMKLPQSPKPHRARRNRAFLSVELSRRPFINVSSCGVVLDSVL